MRKLTTLLAGLILTVHLTSCTSKDSKDESSSDEAVAESTEGTDGDLAKLDAPAEASSDSSVASSDGANEGFLDEQLPEDALGESTKQASNDAPPPAKNNELELENTTPPPAAAEEPKMDAVAEATPPPEATEPTPPPAAMESAPPASDTASIDTGTSPGMSDSSSVGSVASNDSKMSEPAPEAKPKASLKKVETTPFHRNGTLLNAVYVVRPKDNFNKIAKMIYGDSKKSKELKAANPGVTPHVGDKVYYNSPVRPTDDTKIMSFYEDSGMAPEVYVAQEGDNIKKVSKKLLGYDNAWKEIWATNNVESKDALPAGTELRYFKAAPAPAVPPVVAHTDAVPHQDMAMNQAAPPPPPEPAQQAMPDLPPPPPPAEMAPPPPQPVAHNEAPPPPAEMAPPPPPAQADLPPPPPAEAVNPPPPPPVPKKTPGKDVAANEGMDNDMVMTLAGAGIILAGLAAVILIRRRRQNRDMATAFNDTQVGT